MRKKNPPRVRVFVSNQQHYPSFDLNETFLQEVGSKKINQRLASFIDYVVPPASQNSGGNHFEY